MSLIKKLVNVMPYAMPLLAVAAMVASSKTAKSVDGYKVRYGTHETKVWKTEIPFETEWTINNSDGSIIEKRVNTARARPPGFLSYRVDATEQDKKLISGLLSKLQ